MVDKLSFSGQQLSLDDIAAHYADVEQALQQLYSVSAVADPRFTGYTPNELKDELNVRLGEEGRMLAMSVLASVEAAFRIDFLQRVYAKRKDALSRAFRDIYKVKGTRASLEEDIFDGWLRNTTIQPQLISDLKSAFRFRHWLAHGRYWSPKLGRNFDYFSVHAIAEQAVRTLPLVVI